MQVQVGHWSGRHQHLYEIYLGQLIQRDFQAIDDNPRTAYLTIKTDF